MKITFCEKKRKREHLCGTRNHTLGRPTLKNSASITDLSLTTSLHFSTTHYLISMMKRSKQQGFLAFFFFFPPLFFMKRFNSLFRVAASQHSAPFKSSCCLSSWLPWLLQLRLEALSQAQPMQTCVLTLWEAPQQRVCK